MQANMPRLKRDSDMWERAIDYFYDHVWQERDVGFSEWLAGQGVIRYDTSYVFFTDASYQSWFQLKFG